MNQTCTVCLEEKPYTSFGKNFEDEDTYRRWCRSCVNEYSRLHYKKIALRRKAQRLALPLEQVSALRNYKRTGKYQQRKPLIKPSKTVPVEQPVFSAETCREAEHLLVFD